MRVLRSFLTAAVVTVAMTTALSANAQNKGGAGGNFGLGIVVGEPTAITGKYHLDRRGAIDGGVAFDLSRWILVYSDYLYHFPGVFGAKKELAQFTPYVGIGGMLVVSSKSDWERRNERYYASSTSSSTAIGLRVPVGIEWRPQTVPVGVFLEIAPGMTIMPATWSFMQIGLGARFFF